MISNETPLTPNQAWEHFWENIKPTIWDSLDKDQKNRLIIAERDRQGLRKDNKDKKEIRTLRLGPVRIERLLNDFAPGKYRFEQHTNVYLNE